MELTLKHEWLDKVQVGPKSGKYIDMFCYCQISGSHINEK